MSDQMLMSGWAQQSTSFRFDLLDEQLILKGELPVVETARIDNNINRTIKRQMSDLNLPPNGINEIDILKDRVRPVIIYPDGSEYPLGVFLFTDASVTRANFGSVQYADPGDNGVATTTLNDQLVLLDMAVDTPIAFPPGSLISDCIDNLFQRVAQWSPGIEWEIAMSASAIRGDDWFVQAPGSNLLSAMNDLCSMAGFYSPFSNNNGTFVVQEVPDINSLPTFNYQPNQNVYANSIVESTDLFNLPNRFIVINSSLTEQSIYGVWDIPSNAPHSKENRGRVVTDVSDIQGIASNDEAVKAAKAKAEADASSYQWVDFDAVPDPRHDTFDLIGWDGDIYREQSWQLTLAPGGVHHHELRRVYNPDEESIL